MNPIRVLFLYDVEGWAWWYKIRQIQKNISSSFFVQTAKIGDPFDPDEYDFVVTFFPRLALHVSFVPVAKLIVGATLPLALPLLLDDLTERKCLAGFVNSQEMIRQAGKFADLLYCCQNGVDTDFFKPHPGGLKQPLVACWVGNSESKNKKGLELIQNACNLTQIQLLTADANALKQSTEVMTQEDILQRIYYQASMYICASEIEGTPNPALEALACGLPVISTRVGNMPEIIRDGWNGFLIDRSPDAIAEAINKLKAADLRDMSVNARASVENGWTWAQQVKKYENMFGDLLEKRKTFVQKLPKSDKESPDQLIGLARLYQKINRRDRFKQKIRQAVEHADTDLETRINLTYEYAGILEAEKDEQWRYYFENYLVLLDHKNNKAPLDFYRLGSVLKRISRFRDAEQYFLIVVGMADAGDLSAGAYFHLGEIYWLLEDKVNSRRCFQFCLDLNPHHKKAKEYILEIAGAKEV